MDGQDSAAEDHHVTQRQIDVAQRERSADEREAALDAREDCIRDREAVGVERLRKTEAILGEAHQRDGLADARDSLANERDHAASFQSFLHDEDFAPGVKARQAAGLDRSDSKDDRSSAAVDRFRLTDVGPTRREGKASGDARH
jgi:hypothetical protein